MDISTCYKIGYIAKNHGLKGEVSAVLTEPLDPSQTTIFLEINHNLVPYFITKVSGHDAKPILAFENVRTIDEALLLKGSSLYLPKTSRPKLKRGEFYDDELVGFDVEDETAGALGTVAGVIESGGNRLLSIVKEGNEVLVPMNGPFITDISKKSRKIKVDLPEGFLDL